MILSIFSIPRRRQLGLKTFLFVSVILINTSIVSAQFNVTIVAGAGNTNINTTSPFNPTGDDAQLGVDLVLAGLALGDVIINTNTGGLQAGNITLDAQLDYDGFGAGNLFILNSEGDIVLNGNIFDGTTGDLESVGIEFNAPNGSITGPTVEIRSIGGSIDINAGSNFSILNLNSAASGIPGVINVIAAGDITIGNGTISADGNLGGNVFLQSGGNLTTNVASLSFQSIGQNGGNLTMVVGGDIIFPLVIDLSGSGGGGGTLDIQTSGTASTIITSINTTGSSTAGAIIFNVGGALAISSAINLSSGSDSGSNLTVTAGGDVTLSGDVTSSGDPDGGTFDITANGIIDVFGFLDVDGNVNGGQISLSGEEINLGGGVGSVTADGNFGSNGQVTLRTSNFATNIKLGGLIEIGGQLDLLDDDLAAIDQANLGSLTIGSGAGTGAITLGANLTFETITLIQAIGPGGSFDATVSEFSLDGGGHDFDLAFTGDISIATVNNSAGSVSIQSSTGNLSMYGTINEINTVSIGGIPMDGGDLVIATGGSIDVTAINTGIGTPAGNAGDINITSITGAINITGDIDSDANGGSGVGGIINIMSTLGDISTAAISSTSSADNGRAITVSTTGIVSTGEIVSTGGTGGSNVTIMAQAITTGGLTAHGSTVNLTTTSGSVTTGAVTTGFGNGGGALDVTAIGDINLGDIQSSGGSAGGNVTLTGGDINLFSNINAGGGGSVMISGINVLVTGGTVTTSGSMDGGSIDITATGNISTGGGDLMLSVVNGSGGGGSIDLMVTGNIANDLTLNANGSAAGGPIMIDVLGTGTTVVTSLTSDGNFAGGSVDIMTSGDLIFNGTINNPATSSGSGGAVTMSSVGNMLLNGSPAITSTGPDRGGDITLETTGVGSMISVNGNLVTTSNRIGGNITLRSENDILMNGAVNTSTAGNIPTELSGNVDVSSTNGRISVLYIQALSENGGSGGNVTLFAGGTDPGDGVGLTGAYTGFAGQEGAIVTTGVVSNVHGKIKIRHNGQFIVNSTTSPNSNGSLALAPGNILAGDLVTDRLTSSDFDASNYVSTTGNIDIQIPSLLFVTTWKTDNSGISASNQISIPTAPGPAYNYYIDWGDGNTTAGAIGDEIHTYAVAGTYTVSISGTFPQIFFNDTGDREKILTIEQWGSIQWASMLSSFHGCQNMQIVASDSPDLSGVSSMALMFNNAASLNADLNNWDVSAIIDMNSLFRGTSLFNGNISNWDVDNVQDMTSMFLFATMFDQDIGGWNVGSVTAMRGMFFTASAFNQDIGTWDISGVTDLTNMFGSAISFNQDIGNWNTSSVLNISSMFEGATNFNQDITGWDVSNVTLMTTAFSGALSFDQDISGWNVGNVTSFVNTFNGATVFNQNLGTWDVSNGTNMTGMFDNSALSNVNYDQVLIGWASLPSLQSTVDLGAINQTYCNAESARMDLINTFDWFISDAGKNCLTLTNSSPVAAAIDVARDANIILNFDTDVDGPTAIASNIVVSGSLSGLVSGVFSGGGTSTITFDPDLAFAEAEVVTTTISTDIESVTFIPLEGPISFQFTVAVGLVPINLLDSLALVDLFNSLSGSGWTNSENWLIPNQPVRTWAGVAVTDDRVTGLALPNNNMIGEMPSSFANLTQLENLDLSGNELKTFPNVSSFTQLTSLNVSGNRLGFGDLELNVGITGFIYAPQRRFGETLNGRVEVGVDTTISVNITGSSNQYQWFFKARKTPEDVPGVPIEGAISPTYLIESINFNNMGIYYAEVTNSVISDLIIRNRNQNIFVVTDIFGRAIISPETGSVLTDGDVIAYEIEEPGQPFTPFDTVTVNANGEYRFENVVLGDYILLARPGPTFIETVIQTYYKRTNDWVNADILQLRAVEAVDLNMISIPIPFDPVVSTAEIFGTFEVDIPDPVDPEEGLRVKARRRVRRAGISLNKLVTRRRILQEELVLVAYTESNEEGEFSFPNVPPGDYLLNIQFPGIPMDTTTQIKFTIDSSVQDQSFNVSALATEIGISLDLIEETGFYRKYFEDLSIYPNPANEFITLDYEKLNSSAIEVQLLDLNGQLIKRVLLEDGGQNHFDLNVSDVNNGIYLLVFVDLASDNATISSYKVIVSK